MILAALGILALWYLTVILLLRRGLTRVTPGGEPSGHRFSVVIAARNEERMIGGCLASVLDQSIGANRYEVVVVDDRSDDRTASMVDDLAARHANLRLIRIADVPSGVSPKKHAVATGVAAARNPVIACTDADCHVPRTWLDSVDRFMGPDTGLVQGITRYRRPLGLGRWIYSFQSIDFLSHGVVAAAAIGAELPLNANGNNIAYRREAFERVGGYGETGGVLLGDDDLLLQRIWRDRRWRVRFMADIAGAVLTEPTETWGGLLRQRARWGSVSVHYGASQVALLAGLFLFYCSIPVAFAIGLWRPIILAAGLAMLLVKIAGEYLMLIPGTRMFGCSELRSAIPLASVPHLLLVLYAVFAGVFGKHTWKGRVSGRVVERGP